MTIFLAGHETTANALTWTWYLLSQHPEIEKQLYQEIDSVLGQRLPTLEDVSQLRFTEMVMAEAMRIYPPAWIIGRRPLQPYTVEQFEIPAMSIVVISPYLVHHDDRFYAEPSRFDPLRWTEKAKASRPKFAYFPFGAGSRICIGEHFAWMEGVLLIATIAQKWKFRLVANHPIDMSPGITLRPKYGMHMVAEVRSDAGFSRIG